MKTKLFNKIKLNKGHLYGMVALTAAVIAPEALAADTTTATVDKATELAPLLDKVLGSLGGTLGKVIMSLGIILSGGAAISGMNRAVIFTPLGIGMMLGNAKTIVNWMFV